MLAMLISQAANGLVLGFIYVLIAVGLSITFGMLGVINFAHGAFFALGAYFAYQLLHMFGWPAIVFAPVLVGMVGMAVEVLIIRRLYDKDPLSSLIVTFADFDIVRILTAGGPQDQTHIFATYAFVVGIQSGDIPLGASVSLFMFPILAVGAFFVLRGVTRRSKEIAA